MAETETAHQSYKPDVNPWLIAVAVILPTFMEVLDTSIASVALPYIAGSLSSSVNEASWVLTFYLLSNAIILPASTWFSLRFGRRNYLIASVVVFTIASFFVGAADSLLMILVARLVQGAAGGGLQPLSQAILTESFPLEKLGLAMAVYGLGVVVAPILGPTLGGWFILHYSWRWAFYFKVPVGIVAVVLILRYVKDPPYVKNANPGKFDSIGFGLLALGLGSLQIMLDRGQQDDWFGSVMIRWLFCIMIVCLTGFVISQLRHKKTLVDLSVVKYRNFTAGCILIFLFGAVLYAAITLLPLYYQTVMDYSGWWAGLVVSPRGIGAIVGMLVIGVLITRIDTRFLVAAGFGIFAVCSLFWGHIDLQIGPWSLIIPIIISGFASGMVFVPLSAIALAELPKAMVGNGSGLYNLMRNLGGSIGISVFETILARHEQIHHSQLVQHLTPMRIITQNHLHSLTNEFSNFSSSATAHHQALALLGHMVGRQAALLSYVDAFRFMALACFCCLPVVWLLRRVWGRRPAGAH
ncbi:MAG: DHA2 family efflux MFS transporter permease subunit [Bryobacteraceae bacterium]